MFLALSFVAVERSFGYKLAGFNHLGGVEIDSTSSADVYKANHKPK
jgi:hypothetical protein